MNSEDYLLRRDLAPLKRRRFWYVLAIGLCILGLLIAQALVFLAGLCILVIGIVPEIWYRVALRDLDIQQQLDQSHHFFGDEAVLTQRFENQQWLPATWLKVEAFITPPLTVLSMRRAGSAQKQAIQVIDGCSPLFNELRDAYLCPALLADSIQ